jgi:hypothetical protein
VSWVFPQQEAIDPARLIVANGVKAILEQLEAHGLGGGPVRMVPVDQIQVRPEIFQFRVAAIGAGGTTNRLRHCQRYNPALAKVLSCWQNPADGLIYLCDGHHRLQLAKRDGVSHVAVMLLDAPDATAARSLAALQNISEGTATPLDTARWFRDTGARTVDLEDFGISRHCAVIRDALPLLQLDEALFTKACNGEIELAAAQALAGAGHPVAQRELWALAKRKGWDADQIAEAAGIAQAATISTHTPEGCLPGLDALMQEANSNLTELLAVRAEIRRQLRLEVRALGMAAQDRTAAILEAADAAAVDVQQAQAARGQAQALAGLFAAICNAGGPLAELIHELAAEVRGRTTAGQVVNRNLGRIRAVIQLEMA